MKSVIDELDEAERRATPGPWHIGHLDENLDKADIDGADGTHILLECRRVDDSFICAMRNNIRALIQVAKAAEEVVTGYSRLHPDYAPAIGVMQLEDALSKLRGNE